ncbi:MAG: hypothetical protein KAV82_10600 [Phycisphaerae bacterium]|nr:hypothetical protein [Phycisphaerae bacterium]
MEHKKNCHTSAVSDELYERLVAYSQGRGSEDERHELEALAKTDSTAAETLEMIQDTTVALHVYAEATEPDEDGLRRKKAELRRRIGRPSHRRVLALAAASIGLAAVVVVSIWPRNPSVIGKAWVCERILDADMPWFDVRNGQTLEAGASETMRVHLSQGVRFVLRARASVKAHQDNVELNGGQIEGTSSNVPLTIALRDASLVVPAGAMFNIALDMDRGGKCTLWVDKEAVLLQGDVSRIIPANERVEWELGEFACEQ